MASDAVAAALAAQRSLAAQAWPSAGAVRVRIGLHTGEAIARGDHYVGQEIHRASRICDAGHGGQIVVSQTTAELVRGSLPEGATLAPLGDYRLKDLGQRSACSSSAPPACRATSRGCAAWTYPPTCRPNAPASSAAKPTSAPFRERLAEHRLVTLTGIGGSGKTRLALQVGALELGNFADGVFFVDLAPVATPTLLAATVASACGLMLGDASGARRGRSKTACRGAGAAQVAAHRGQLRAPGRAVAACSTAPGRLPQDDAAGHQPRGAGRRRRAGLARAVAGAARRRAR